MEWEEILTSAITALAIGGAMSYLNSTAKQVPLSGTGPVELRMSKLYAFLGYLSVIICIAALVAGLVFPEEDAWLGIALCILIFGGAGIPCLMWYLNHRVRFDDKQIASSNWLNKQTVLQWQEIDQVKFRVFEGCLVLSAGMQKVKVHQHLVGFVAVLDRMEACTAFQCKDLKLPADFK